MSDSSDVDKKLGELLNVIKDSVESKKDGDYSSTVSGTSAIGTEDIGKNTEMQKFIANECMYHQLLIPVTPEVALGRKECSRHDQGIKSSFTITWSSERVKYAHSVTCWWPRGRPTQHLKIHNSSVL